LALWKCDDPWRHLLVGPWLWIEKIRRAQHKKKIQTQKKAE
jgi:hypothetical protein